MRKVLLAILIALAALAHAQAWDIEAGRELALGSDGTSQSWYFLARYSLPLSSEVLGAQLWALPEIGVWVPDGAPYHGYGRLQLLIDQTFGTVFLDARAGQPAGPGSSLDGGPDRHTLYALIRAGIRFGWPP